MIKVEHLSKSFGSHRAVDDVSFTVEKGEVLGFLGPNGAGKSTTMRMLTGYLPSDAGKVTIGDYDIDNQPIQAKSLVGYLPENAPAYGDLTVTAFLKFVATLRGLKGRAREEAVERVIETCFLQPVRRKPIDNLSKGYLHRTCFAQSIIHDPDVLILDEPTDGLDPNQKHEARNLIKRMGERKAIVVSTHILEEVDAICSRVIVINNGKLVANGLPTDLKAQSPLSGSVTIRVHDCSYADVATVLEKLDGVDKLLCLEEENGSCHSRAFAKGDKKDLALEIHKVVSEKGWTISELQTDEGRLDEVFREITSFEGGKE